MEKILANVTRGDSPVRLLNLSDDCRAVKKDDVIAGSDEVD